MKLTFNTSINNLKIIDLEIFVTFLRMFYK